jgi:hypothetical protein
MHFGEIFSLWDGTESKHCYQSKYACNYSWNRGSSLQLKFSHIFSIIKMQGAYGHVSMGAFWIHSDKKKRRENPLTQPQNSN